MFIQTIRPVPDKIQQSKFILTTYHNSANLKNLKYRYFSYFLFSYSESQVNLSEDRHALEVHSGSKRLL